jgi:hypothetical protein
LRRTSLGLRRQAIAKLVLAVLMSRARMQPLWRQK